MPAGSSHTATPQATEESGVPGGCADRAPCCHYYHQAIELVGKRWTGAILIVLMEGPLRFSEIKQLVPDLSDRLLSERLKELEGEGIVVRGCEGQGTSRVCYELTDKGRDLEPAVRAIKTWARNHLAEQ